MRRTALAAALAVLLAGTAQAAVTEFVIYKGADFRGPAQTIKGEVNNLEGGFAKEAASLVVKGGYWEVCTEHHFQGDCYILAPGDYPRLSSTLNKKIVAVRFKGTDEKLANVAVREGPLAHLAKKREEIRADIRETRRETREELFEPRREARREAREEWREPRREARRDRWLQPGAVDLYGQPDFRGRSIRIEDHTADLWERRFDGRASSMIVHDGTWQVCSQPRFEGYCRTLGPGEYPRLGGFDDRISSLRQVG